MVKARRMSWGYSKRKKQAYPKGSTAKAPRIGRGSSMSGIRRRRGQDKLPVSPIDKNQVRLEAAKDLGLIAAERNPVVRTAADAYDTADALERLRTGERKPLIDKIRDR